MLSTQLTLPIHLPSTPTFENFYAGSNTNLIKLLENFCKGWGEPFVYLWGYTASGRTHLLQACCYRAYQLGLRVAYLPMRELIVQSNLGILEGLEKFELVCIDDFENVAISKRWEEEIFHLYNHLREQQGFLLIAACDIPDKLGLHLLDLISRLHSGLLYQIKPLTDPQKVCALQLRAQAGGFELTSEVADFLVARLPRDGDTLFKGLRKLEEASLISQRKVTIPFVKQVLTL